MFRIFTVFVAFTVLFLFCVGSVTYVFGPLVEKDLVQKASMALGQVEGLPLDALNVAASGRDIEVSGKVRRKAHLEGAMNMLGGLVGVANLENHLEWVPIDPWLSVVRNKDGSLVADGLLSSRAEKGRLSMAVRGADEGMQMVVKAATDEDVADASWLENTGDVLPALLTMDRVNTVIVREGKVTLAGDVYSDTTSSAAETLLAGIFEDSGFEIENLLDVVPPPLAPWITLRKESGEKLFANGALTTSNQKHELLGIATDELEKGAKITSRVETGDNVANAAWWEGATTILPAILAELEPCEVEIRNGKLKLSGEVTSEPMKVSIVSLVEQNFPSAEWERSVKIGVKEPPVPSRLSVIVFSGDQIFLKGVLPSIQVKNKLLALAGEQIPGKEIVDQIELRENAMAPKWLEDFSAFLPGYSANALRGGMTIDDKQLVIEARVDSDAKWDALFALAEKHFPMSEFRHRIDLRVIDPSAPDPDDPLAPVDPDAVMIDPDAVVADPDAVTVDSDSSQGDL